MPDDDKYRNKTLLTVGEVAKVCGVSQTAAKKWIDGGSLRGFRLPSLRDRRVYRQDLIDFMRGLHMPEAMIAVLEPVMEETGDE